MVFQRSFLITFAIVLLLAVGFGAGYWANDNLNPGEQFPTFNEAFRIITTNGLKDFPPPPALEYGMINGMIQAYDDPYTSFIEPARHELESHDLQGSFGGIGARISTDADGYIVLFPFPDGPASDAGIEDGDRLIAVDQLEITSDVLMDQILSAIRGPVDSTVRLTVIRDAEDQPIQIEILRDEIPLPSVTWHPEPDEPWLGIIEVNLISASTSKEILIAVEELENRGATHFVLDLRNNPGGLLTAGVDIARIFLKDGVVLQQQYRDRPVETFRVERRGPLAEIPLAVLINENSASAAEIIAGALKAHGRATLIGTPSFGKDTIQLVFDLNDGSSIHVTAAHWWIPDLEPPLAENGLIPDISITPTEEPSGRDPAIQAAVELLFEK